MPIGSLPSSGATRKQVPIVFARIHSAARRVARRRAADGKGRLPKSSTFWKPSSPQVRIHTWYHGLVDRLPGEHIGPAAVNPAYQLTEQLAIIRFREVREVGNK